MRDCPHSSLVCWLPGWLLSMAAGCCCWGLRPLAVQLSRASPTLCDWAHEAALLLAHACMQAGAPCVLACRSGMGALRVARGAVLCCAVVHAAMAVP